MNRQRKTRKPHSLKQNPKKYLTQIDAVMTDKAITEALKACEV